MLELFTAYPVLIAMMCGAFGIQFWALTVIYQMKAMIREQRSEAEKKAVADDARYEALKLVVSSKIDENQARTVVHQYNVDLKRMRDQATEEVREELESLRAKLKMKE